jgi:hypothetical protein
MSQIKYGEETQKVAEGEEKVEAPEITPELVAELIEKTPELEGCDPVKLEAGIKNEIKFFDIFGDIETVAKLAAAHIKEFPEADYYAALATFEASLVPPPVEEVPAEETPAEHEESETPAEEEVEEEAKEEEEVEEAKKAKVPGVKAATKTDKLTKVKK